MKKLILLLTLTMMFGQSKLETRVYTINNLEIPTFGEVLEIGIREMLQDFNIDEILIEAFSIDGSGSYAFKVVAYTPSTNEFGDYLLIQNKEDYNGTISFHEQGMPFDLNSEKTLNVKLDSYNGSLNPPFFATFKLAITAEFPVEDTGYIEDDFDYCVEPGANLMSYPCDSAVALLDAIPSDALSQFEGIIGAGSAATNLNGTWVGSITNLTPGAGYWIKSNSALCFNYDCSEN